MTAFARHKLKWVLGTALAFLSSFPSTFALSQTTEARLSPSSERFGFLRATDGSESVVFFDAEGHVRATAPLVDEVAVFGGGRFAALLSKDARGAGWRVRILDDSGNNISQFGIAADETIAIGAETIVVHPRADHARGTAFDIEFLTISGSRLSAHNFEGLVLLQVSRYSNDHWVAISVDRSREGFSVHHFDPRGALVWEFHTSEQAFPVVGMSPSGKSAVIGMLAEDMRTTQLNLLDASGRLVTSQPVREFRLAQFSPDERYLLLAGQDAVQLRDARDASAVWLVGGDFPLVTGEAVTFSRDGLRFFVLSQARPTDDAAPAPVRLRSYEVGRELRAPVERVVGEIPSDRRISVLGFSETTDGRLSVVADQGIWYLRP